MKRAPIFAGALAVLCVGIAARELRRPSIPADALLLSGGAAHWSQGGFFEVVPPVRRRFVRVFMRIPPGARIDLAQGANGPVLRVPSGTEADRVEYRAAGGRWRVADVRGTTWSSEGERFHVYRPSEDGRLFGAAWDRGDPSGPSHALSMFRPAMERGVGFAPGDRGFSGERSASIERFGSLMGCAACHVHEQSEASSNEPRRGPRRGTDASGVYSLHYALVDRAPMEGGEANDGDPFVRATCEGPGGTSTTWTRDAASPGPSRCPDGSVPYVDYDLRAARLADRPHARAVCASRRALAELLTSRAKHAYRPAFEDCGVEL